MVESRLMKMMAIVLMANNKANNTPMPIAILDLIDNAIVQD